MHSLVSFYAQRINFSPAAEAAVQASCTRQEVKRGALLLKAGEMANWLYFIESGILRVYTQVGRNEATLWLGLANSFTTSLTSFLTRGPNLEYIHALSDCVVYAIHHERLRQLYDEHRELDRLGRLLFEEYALQIRDHSFSLRCHTTTERYENLLRQRPELFQQVPLTYIASFLGMTAQAMSLVRAKRI